MLNYFMRTPSNKINETNSNESLDDHIMIPLTLFFFCNHNFAVKINFFSPNHTKGKSSCCLIKLVYRKYFPHHWSHIDCISLSKDLSLLPTFAGALREQNRTRPSFNKIPTNYISVESSINVL